MHLVGLMIIGDCKAGRVLRALAWTHPNNACVMRALRVTRYGPC